MDEELRNSLAQEGIILHTKNTTWFETKNRAHEAGLILTAKDYSWKENPMLM